MNGVNGQVEDIYLEGGRVRLDRDGGVQRLDGVRELKDELRLFGEVLESALWVSRGG